MSLNPLASVLRAYLLTKATLAANLRVKRIGLLNLEKGKDKKKVKTRKR